jgi:putative transposase
MLNATKVRLYPTVEQEHLLACQFGCARWAWNWALESTQKRYKETGKGMTFFQMIPLFPPLKKEHEWLHDAYSQVLQASLRNLSASFQNFFEKRARYPRFKSKHGKQSIQYPQNVKIVGSKIHFPKVGDIESVIHREIVGRIKTVTVSKNPCGHYYASILTDDDILDMPISTDGKAIGVDVGLTHLAITSDGSKFDNPHFIAKSEKNLKRKQQSLSRKKKGSKSRNKARLLVARVHERIKNQRRDYLHKVSRRVVDENQVIITEDLNVKGITANHNLAKAVSDVGWGTLTAFLKYKAERDGKAFIKVSRWFPSSKVCSKCGYQIGKMPLDVRSWTCPSCNTHHDRDINAARNIRDEGLRILASGIGATAGGGNIRRKLGRKSSINADAIEPGSPCL